MDDAARKAIEHLAEALYLLSCVRDQGDTTDVPIHIGPTNAGHTIHVTARTAEALSDAVDSMNAYMASESVEDDKLGAAARYAATPAGDHEAISSGEWSAAAVAQNDPDLWDEVNAAFAAMDAQGITDNVMDDRIADPMTVIRALDDVLGEVPYPYAEEDGDL